MTDHQFTIIANLLKLCPHQRAKAHQALFNGNGNIDTTNDIVEQIRATDAAIRGAYVIHGPMDFRITVGHRDFHRAPGALAIRVGDTVRLIAQSTERWIPVRVTSLPKTAADYFSGVITEQLVPASRFQVGNAVRFSEDQVYVEEPRASRRQAIP